MLFIFVTADEGKNPRRGLSTLSLLRIYDEKNIIHFIDF